MIGLLGAFIGSRGGCKNGAVEASPEASREGALRCIRVQLGAWAYTGSPFRKQQHPAVNGTRPLSLLLHTEGPCWQLALCVGHEVAALASRRTPRDARLAVWKLQTRQKFCALVAFAG